MSFDQLKLNPLILSAVAASGYTTPTPIQEKAIPVALAGSDILASAQTGTGKTAAFMLPALNRLAEPSKVLKSKGPRMLVLTPTRELALQVTEAAMNYGKNLRQINVVSILGGMPYFRQRQQMSRAVDIMVATPGRLLDYLGQGELDFSRIEILVLDEADRMLDMGFRDAVQDIVAALPAQRQTLLFSATIDDSITRLAGKLLKDPVRIEVSAPKTRHVNIEQKVHYVTDLESKKRLLTHIISQDNVAQAIIFTATKRSADQLAENLADQGMRVAALHGNMRQNARNRTLDKMHNGSVKFLVATDVAARGIDVRGISHIINFDLPQVTEDYVHRIGRTGRAGANGTAISLVYPRDRGQFRRIESFVGHEIPTISLPGFEVQVRSGSDGEGDRANRGGRGGRGRNSGSGPRSSGQRPYRGNSSAGSSRGGFRDRNSSDRPSSSSYRDSEPERSSYRGSGSRGERSPASGAATGSRSERDTGAERAYGGRSQGSRGRDFGPKTGSSDRSSGSDYRATRSVDENRGPRPAYGGSDSSLSRGASSWGNKNGNREGGNRSGFAQQDSFRGRSGPRSGPGAGRDSRSGGFAGRARGPRRNDSAQPG